VPNAFYELQHWFFFHYLIRHVRQKNTAHRGAQTRTVVVGDPLKVIEGAELNSKIDLTYLMPSPLCKW